MYNNNLYIIIKDNSKSIISNLIIKIKMIPFFLNIFILKYGRIKQEILKRYMSF